MVELMVLSDKEKLISRVAVLALALLVCDFLLDSYLERRSALIEQRNARLRTLDDDHLLLRREDHLRKSIAAMGSSLMDDSSTVEGKFLHLSHDWADQAGVRNTSFQRLRTDNSRGFAFLTFHASATGNLWAVAQFLYRMETASFPLRIDNVNLRPKGDADEDVQIHLTLSTPCKANPPRTISEVHVASAAEESTVRE
jgi:hypothetical protein